MSGDEIRVGLDIQSNIVAGGVSVARDSSCHETTAVIKDYFLTNESVENEKDVGNGDDKKRGLSTSEMRVCSATH